MAYIGNKGSLAGFVNQPSKQDLTGATGGTLTLTHAVSGPEDISLFINNVRQEPTESYTVTGTTVTLQGYTVAASDDIYVLYNGLTQLSSVPVDGSVSTAKIADNAITMAKLATSGTLPALDGSALTGVGVSVARVSEIIASGHAGGSTLGSWATRALNTEEFDPDSIVTLSSNQFTLGAGKYLLYFDASGFKTGRHTAKIYNVTDTADVGKGLNAYGTSSYDVNTVSSGMAFVNISASKVFELQHRVSATKSSNGLGSGASDDIAPNTFSSVTIIKVG
jgi:hypothetical protein